MEGVNMTTVRLYDQNGKFQEEVVVYRNRPDIILHADRFYIFRQDSGQYREGDLIVAEKPESGAGHCNVYDLGRKDRCLRCAAEIDPASGIRYCAQHMIGICSEHKEVNCSTCGYNIHRK